MKRLGVCAVILALMAITLIPDPASARNPYRRAFFNVYSSANGTTLDDVPSNGGHCGVCHFDFDGSGQRNPYGLSVEVAINSGMYGSNEDAILSLDGLDADNDGYTNNTEITSTLFTNTPTFPGLKASNYTNAVNVDLADIVDYLTPSGGTDTTPPEVIVTAPDGGEVYDPNTTQTVTWTATDASGISHVNIYMSDDSGASFKPVARNLPHTGSFDWFVPNMPGAQTMIAVEAYDNAGNDATDLSDADFTIDPYGGPQVVPTTLRDFEMAGTQPLESGILEDPSVNCVTCHGEYDHVVEPWHTWRGSMMAQAARDPLWLATMVVAEQQAPGSGDICLRCHTPGGWQEGRSTDTSGGMLTFKDRQSVQCDYCHRLVDPHYQEGISPPEDEAILAELAAVPLAYANGQFVTDPDPIRRGPYADAQASHQFLESPFHRSCNICGTCHDVSNPAFVQGSNPAEYVPQDFDTPHPDGDLRNMFPVERTFSEWSMSEYAATGVYAPLFAGNKPDGMVSTCQDCHMRDVAGAGSSEPGSPTRTDLPLHDLTGGNTFVPDLVQEWYPTDGVTAEQLLDGKQRALHMLQLAATLQVATGQSGNNPTIDVTVINETGHKLPSGYPEGRRIWLNVRAYDTYGALVYESGAYDFDTGVLTHDEDLKIYEIKPGISTRLADLLALTAGPSFNFVLNDSVYKDNRIPPRGFTNAAFEAIQSPPVAYSYADGQHSDVTTYVLPNEARDAEVYLYYQTTSKEYVEFLKNENITDDTGQQMYDSWVAHDRCPPVQMEYMQILLDLTGVTGELPGPVTMLRQNFPNPFNPATTIKYSLEKPGRAQLRIYDERGRLVRTLVDAELPAGPQEIVWKATDDRGQRVASGVYHYILKANGKEMRRKMVVIK